MANDLASPLGKLKRPQLSLKLSYGPHDWPIGRVAALLSVLLVGGIVLRTVLTEDPLGGQPVAIAQVTSTLDKNPVAQTVSSPESRLSIVSNDTDTPQIIDVSPEAISAANADSHQRNDSGIFPELTESTQYGPVPRIGPDGQTPFKTYSRPSLGPELIATTPVIAIIVTGMGLSEAGTLDAINALPENVTLAFAPYARTLNTTTTAARSAGHELMLEVPMEPFDYPDSDPGPKTLLTGYPPRANLDRLFWLMARFGGYMGLINNLGAKFTSSASDLSPFMEELGTRGIGFVDDGSSNRSLTFQLARANKVPYSRAAMILDTNPSRAAILARLDELETTAREKGSALAVVSGLPVSISTLVSWAADLKEKGIELVPASALMSTR